MPTISRCIVRTLYWVSAHSGQTIIVFIISQIRSSSRSPLCKSGQSSSRIWACQAMSNLIYRSQTTGTIRTWAALWCRMKKPAWRRAILIKCLCSRIPWMWRRIRFSWRRTHRVKSIRRTKPQHNLKSVGINLHLSRWLACSREEKIAREVFVFTAQLNRVRTLRPCASQMAVSKKNTPSS